jgi:3-hydroxyisobutyrate dehydrogenase-like beta-hydroxyacid dehydrogenase
MDSVNVGVLGLGEAGSAFAAGMVANGATVRGFDPAEVAMPAGVTDCMTAAQAVEGADAVIALTHAAQALDAAESAVGHLAPGAFYADFATGDPGLKREIAKLAREHGLRAIDGAVMNPVPLAGVATPVDVAGDEAEAFVTLMSQVGLQLTAVSSEPGVAATRKLLRSVLVKGLSALIIESMRAAGTAGEADWFRDHVFAVLNRLDREYVIRLVEGNVKHSVRRVHEMEAASELLRQLGETPLTSEATRQVLESVPERGVPAMQDDRPTKR